MNFFQKDFSLKQRQRGFHLITDEIFENIPEINNFKTGIANIFIKHTSASLTINENADPDVRKDFETHFNFMIPENSKHFLHTSEGPDDMTSHIKSSILGCSLNIPLKDGRFNMGIWQGIYLCEHRNHGGKRNISVTLFGM
ncbi:MAG TPA: secondary thiamine-phosphate synthase enzyme YjbQ [Ignavibacteria bacterium]|nr:secondary thiamine-phosphate synthase enzyme YjbQ [Ignavibacteria bacterium]